DDRYPQGGLLHDLGFVGECFDLDRAVAELGVLVDHDACQCVVMHDELAAQVAEPDSLLTHARSLSKALLRARSAALGHCRRDAGDLGGERMDHPAARIPSCQTSVRSACRYAKLLAISVSPALSRLPGAPRCTLNLMKDAAEAAEPSGRLPPALASALAAFERHLRSERSLSPHTVRAYTGDISSLLEYAGRQGVGTPEGLDVTELRGWLALQ